jgi:hypothetical protein
MNAMITHFISGHLDLSEREFREHYSSRVYDAIANGDSFIVGDARGADSFAQHILAKCMVEDSTLYDRVVVYHMFENPRNNFGRFKTKGGFQTDDERDCQMTADSTHDILWIRSPEEQKKKIGKKYNPSYINGTTKNMMRREGQI